MNTTELKAAYAAFSQSLLAAGHDLADIAKALVDHAVDVSKLSAPDVAAPANDVVAAPTEHVDEAPAPSDAVPPAPVEAEAPKTE